MGQPDGHGHTIPLVPFMLEGLDGDGHHSGLAGEDMPPLLGPAAPLEPPLPLLGDTPGEDAPPLLGNIPGEGPLLLLGRLLPLLPLLGPFIVPPLLGPPPAFPILYPGYISKGGHTDGGSGAGVGAGEGSSGQYTIAEGTGKGNMDGAGPQFSPVLPLGGGLPLGRDGLAPLDGGGTLPPLD